MEQTERLERIKVMYLLFYLHLKFIIILEPLPSIKIYFSKYGFDGNLIIIFV